MEEKYYETCAKKVVTILHQHKEGTKEIADAIQKLSTDRRYSDYGKEQVMKKLSEELNTINQEKSDELKEVVQQFVNKYQTNIKDDGNTDPQDVANVLKIIEMCGPGMTVDVLRAAVEPIKGSCSTLKMLHTILLNKSQRALAIEAAYDTKCIELLEDYIGQSAPITEYEAIFAEVKGALDAPLLVRARINAEGNYSGSVINRLLDDTPYITYALGDSMMKIGKMHDLLSVEYPGFFK